MMTAAALCGVFQWNSRSLGETPWNDPIGEDNGELFLKELGLLLGKDPLITSTKPMVCQRDDGESIVEQEEKQRCGPLCSQVMRENGLPNANECAIRIQTCMRRYLQQRHYRIQQLQRRLQQINQSRGMTLAQIAARKERKLAKIQRKYDRREERLEQEFQKVSGIVHYLKRDQIRCRKELDNHQQLCRDLKTDHQRLLLIQERTITAVRSKKHELEQLQTTNHQLLATSETYKEMIRQVQSHLVKEGRVDTSYTPPSRRTPKAKSYETRIRVNCVNEAEEKCFHYRLVQDVYTLAPRIG